VSAAAYLVPRPQLVALLLNPELPRMTLLLAPSGYGKSVLLTQLAQGAACLEVDLKNQGGQTDALIGALIEAVSNTDPAVAAQPLTSHREFPLTPKRFSGGVASLPALVLTFDHAERLSPEGAAWLLKFIQLLPVPHRAVIAARALTSFEVPYLVATGLVQVLGPEQLAFDRHNFAALGVGEDAPESETLSGWPLGVMLRRAGAYGQRVEDLIAALLAALPADLQEELPRLAPYERWRPELPAALGVAFPARWLEVLVRERLPIIQNRDGSFRPHETLLEVLDAQLRRSVDTWRQAYEQAAAVGREQGSGLVSIRQLLHVGLVVPAAALAEETLPKLAARGQYRSVREVIGLFPGEAVDASPELKLLRGLALMETGEVRAGLVEFQQLAADPASRWKVLPALAHAAFLTSRLVDAQELVLEALKSESRYTLAQQLDLKGTLGNVLRDLGDPEGGLKVLLDVARLSEQGSLPSSLAHTMVALNVAYLRLNRTGEALEAATRATVLYEQLDQTERLAVPLLNTAVLLGMQGDHRRAEALLRRALELAEAQRSRILTSIHYVLSDLLRAQGKLADATLHAVKAVDYARQSARSDRQFMAELLLSELHRQQQRSAEADRHVQLARQVFELHRELAESKLLVDLFAFHEGQVALAAGDLHTAETYFHQAPAGVGELQAYHARAALHLAEIARRRGTLNATSFAAFLTAHQQLQSSAYLQFDLPVTGRVFQEAARQQWPVDTLPTWVHEWPLPAPPQLLIRTFGPLRVTVDDQPVTFTGSSPRRARELLALLALTPYLTSHDLQQALIGEGKGDHRNALTTARQSLAQATGLAQPIVQDEHKRYHFSPELAVTTDLELLRNASAQKNFTVIREVLKNHPEFLPGIDQRWAQDLRETDVAEEVYVAYRLLGTDTLERHEYAEALKSYQRLLELQPGDEYVYRTVLEIQRALQVRSAETPGGQAVISTQSRANEVQVGADERKQ